MANTIEPNPQVKKALAELEEQQGITPGLIYYIGSGWPKGTQLVFTDAGIFATSPKWPGAYLLPDARLVSFR